MLSAPVPNYLLLSAAAETSAAGRWRFVLRSSDGTQCLRAEAAEPGVGPERLALLSVVRGLEALERPSRVVLVTPSPYVREGIQRGLPEWQKNGWRWERFGQMVRVRNLDLWQRVARAMEFHQVDCRLYRIDSPHTSPSRRATFQRPRLEAGGPAAWGTWLVGRLRAGFWPARWLLGVGGRCGCLLAVLASRLWPARWFG